MKRWVGWKINSLQATKGHWAVFWELVAVSKGYFAAHLRNLSDRETTTRSWTDLLGLSWMMICRCSSIQCSLFGFSTSNSLVAMPGDTHCAHRDRCSRPSHSGYSNDSTEALGLWVEDYSARSWSSSAPTSQYIYLKKEMRKMQDGRLQNFFRFCYDSGVAENTKVESGSGTRPDLQP